jgi:hypothetical protein
MGLTSTPSTRENNRIGSDIYLSDAEDVHLLGNTVGYKWSIKTTSRMINTYDFSARSEQSSL